MHADSVRLAVLLALYGCAGVATPLLAADVPPERGGPIVAGPPGWAAGAPVLVVGREQIDRSGLASLGDLVQQLPMSGATINTKYNGGGEGSTLVDLRDLDAKRTLVLVDGRRFIQNLGGATDLTAIPLAAVERIEILATGNSALHGADAVAGVINVVLRHDHDGAEARAYLGEYEQGDGRTEAYDLTIGSSSERTSVLLNASYVRQEPVLAGDRGISAVPMFGFPGNDVLAGASSTTPFGRLGFSANGGRLPNGAPGTLTLIPGRPGTSAADFRPFVQSRDSYNFVPENYLSTPQERTALYAAARHALTEATSFHTTALVNERRSEQRLAGLPLVFGTAGLGLARFTIPASALFNPFGADVTRAQFRPTIEPRSFRQDVDTFRFTGAFAGEIEAWERPWAWSLGYGYTDTEQRDVATGLFDLNRLRAGLGPSFRDAAGVARCGTPAAPIAGCVPLNIFGGPDGFTREMADFAGFTPQNTLYREQHAYHASLAGDLFELPAGPLAFAAGYEYRREFGFDQPDALVATGAASVSARPATRGGFSADDAFVALAVPLLDDLPFARSFALDVAARHSDYANFGATTNFSYGFRWQPSAEWLVHGARADTFRAPSLADLFEGESRVFSTADDPCDVVQTPAPDVLARCRSGFGGTTPVLPGYQATAVQRQFRVGGNPELEPESGRTRSLGVRYAPEALPGFAAWLGWSEVEVRDLIGQAGLQFVLYDCYVRANAATCRYIVRAHGTEPDGSFAGQFNLPFVLEHESWDLGVRHVLPTRAGTLAIAWDATYTSHHRELDIHGDVDESAGNLVGAAFDRGALFHRLVSTLALDWQRGDYGATLGLRHRSGLDEDCSGPRVLGRPELCSNPAGSPQFPDGENHLDATTYVDLQARWDAPWRAQLALGLRNAFDEDPPVSYSTTDGNFPPSYDLPGRFWYVAYSQQF